MGQRSISRRIAGDRGAAGFFAFIASLAPFAGVVGMGYLIYHLFTDPSTDFESDGGYFWVGFLVLGAVLFWIVTRWTYDSVHAALTPQRVQAMWLRRFQAEGGDAFRTSRVIDRLSRYGVSALTLQDRDVQLSFEQRRNRLAPMFWLLFIPIAALITYAVWTGWQNAQTDIMDLPPAQDLRTGIGNALGAVFALIVVGLLLFVGLFLGIMATVLIVMILAALAGPIGATMSKNRDDFRGLNTLLKRLQRGKRRGASVVRISDANWREAVTSSLGAVDVAIIDLTNVSDHVAWEIGEAAKACTQAGLVFICRDGVAISPAAKAAIRQALGREGVSVVHYPARRGASDKHFARDLRTHIYDAADLRAAYHT
jgi:MFS family permease